MNIKIAEPEFIIKVGIKEGEVVLVDWSELPDKTIPHEVYLLLKKAVDFMKGAETESKIKCKMSGCWQSNLT